jgi:hypothetical protein
MEFANRKNHLRPTCMAGLTRAIVGNGPDQRSVRREGGSERRPAERHSLADLNLRIADSRVILPLSIRRCHSQGPGVASGASRHMLDHTTTLRPFCITPSTLYLSRRPYRDIYRSFFAITRAGKLEKTVTIFGCEVDAYRCYAPRYTFKAASASAKSGRPSARARADAEIFRLVYSIMTII